jgi:hypothetical protein
MRLARFGLDITGEPLFPLLGVLAVLGGLASLARGQFLLLAWWITTIVFAGRATWTLATAPMAMLAGVAVAAVLIPLMDGRLARTTGSPRPGPFPQGSSEVSPAPPAGAASAWLPVLVLGFFFLYSTYSALTPGRDFASLPEEERVAMRWVAEQTPPGSRMLVLARQWWWVDKTSEWFPVLARRTSVATAQGYEWVPGGMFARKVDQHRRVHGCGGLTSACLEDWSRETGIEFTHVYIARDPSDPCCEPLLNSLRADPRLRLVYDGPGAAIFSWPRSAGRGDRPGHRPGGEQIPGRAQAGEQAVGAE